MITEFPEKYKGWTVFKAANGDSVDKTIVFSEPTVVIIAYDSRVSVPLPEGFEKIGEVVSVTDQANPGKICASKVCSGKLLIAPMKWGGFLIIESKP